MSARFVHSVKVPRLYKESAKSIKKVILDGESFKGTVSRPNHPNVQGIYALVSEALQHCKELDFIIEQTQILVENPRFDPWLAKILITELLWGKKRLASDAKPVLTILEYKEKLQKALLQNSDAAAGPCDKKKAKLPRYVRINTILTSIDEAIYTLCDEGWTLLPKCVNYSTHLDTIANLNEEEFIQDFHIPEVLIFPHSFRFYDHPGYLKNKLLLQDKASCLPAFLMSPKPDSEILDMCAAPGMKTTQLAAIVKTGKIYAVEMNGDRYKTLCDFVDGTNATCVQTIQADALTISSEQYPNIKYILVDPSCSGSGMDRIEVNVQNPENLQRRIKKLQSLQSMILGHALQNFPNVKKVAYSTCSIYPEENEFVVDEALRKFGDKFTLVNLKRKLKNEWDSVGSPQFAFGHKCIYALPERDLCKGFFLAIFKRKSKVPEDVIPDVIESPRNQGEPEFNHCGEEDTETSNTFQAFFPSFTKLPFMQFESSVVIQYNGRAKGLQVFQKEI
ncbi:hypothetical protein QAD02_018867 [Eretmocerus hayati]|uniref:Uncharacterized protein n=1 Tax=Eretmocerus hayati TaxID=131215 RepID=A0ACC2PI20_9HYME|nr:hypothetical protein QAD02_018867 [Eretmocerus hayati]